MEISSYLVFGVGYPSRLPEKKKTDMSKILINSKAHVVVKQKIDIILAAYFPHTKAKRNIWF